MFSLIKRNFFWVILALFLIYSAISIYRSSFIVHGVRYFVLSDDEMIGMKYAYNFAHGYGLVWNANGERVEGITNPLWVFYMALIHLFPIPLAKISLVIQISGMLFMTGTLYFVKKIVELVSNSSSFIIFVSIFFTAFYFPLINWSVILGTEVSILTLLLTWAVFLAFQAVKNKKFPLMFFFLLGIGTLVRMDFIIPSLIMIGYLIILDVKNRKKYFYVGIPIVLSFLAMLISLRSWYYHDFLPNTYYQKMTGFPLIRRIARGLYVSLKAFFPNLITMSWFLILGPFVYTCITKNRYMILLLILFTGQIIYSVYVGGDAWEHYGGANRYIAIVMPLFFIALSATIYSIRKQFNLRSTRKKKLYKIIELVSICLFFLVLNKGANNTWSLSELFMVGKNITTLEKKGGIEFSYRLNSITKPNAKIAIAAAGIVPYFTQRYYVDLLGKNDKVIAREPAHLDGSYDSLLQKYTSFYPGHMKWDYQYVLKKYKPDVFASLYQKGDEHNENYLKKDYILMVSPEGYEFFILKGSPNVMIRDLKLNNW